eukprot:m51a1_g2217 hypothetical protein (477) ;mRNA; r:212591-214663
MDDLGVEKEPTFTRARAFTAYDQPEGVPVGYVLKFTNKGRPFYETATTAVDADDDEAKNEHLRERLGFMTPLDEIERRFGVGTRLYFTFLKYVILVNVVLFMIQFANWAQFIASNDSQATVMCNYPNRDFSNQHSCKDTFLNFTKTKSISLPGARGSVEATRQLEWWEKLFIAAYSRDQYLWCPLFMALVRLVMRDNLKPQHESPWNFRGNADIIEANRNLKWSQIVWRRAVSYSIFALMIAVSGVSIYFIQNWGTRKSAMLSTRGLGIGLSVLISIIIIIINIIWKEICVLLTILERHSTWSGHRLNDMVKLFLFRIINVTVMYAAMQTAVETSAEKADYTCPLQDNGIKFIALILCDLVLMNAFDMLYPIVVAHMKRRFPCLRGEGSDESDLPEFDVAEEYLEVLYRQFVLFMGSLSAPLLPLLSLMTNGAEYFLDKYRMLHLCQRPKRLEHPLLGLTVGFMLMAAVAAIVSYP